MDRNLRQFESITRRAKKFNYANPVEDLHQFEERNVHAGLPVNVRNLFDDAHYCQATFEAFKYLDKEIQRHSLNTESGFKLMMQVFGGTSPAIKLNPLSNTTEIDEQEGYKFIFAGGMKAIRNPRGHEYTISDDIDTCLDHLCFVSMLLRKLEESGYR